MAFEEKFQKINRTNKFRGPHGHRLLKALFVDYYGEDKSKALYTLDTHDKQDSDGKIYPSLYRLYMETGDLYERDFALKYFESWDHWDELRNTSWLKPHVEKWRKELEILIKSEALLRIQMEAAEGGKNSYNANVYLAKGGWKEDVTDKLLKENTKSSKGAGRPSKAQIQEEATRLALESHNVNNDLKRLGLN